MPAQGIANLILLGISLIALGVGIYGLSDSGMAAIALPISLMAYLAWKTDP